MKKCMRYKIKAFPLMMNIFRFPDNRNYPRNHRRFFRKKIIPKITLPILDKVDIKCKYPNNYGEKYHTLEYCDERENTVNKCCH